jgi:hypothetical protein
MRSVTRIFQEIPSVPAESTVSQLSTELIGRYSVGILVVLDEFYFQRNIQSTNVSHPH